MPLPSYEELAGSTSLPSYDELIRQPSFDTTVPFERVPEFEQWIKRYAPPQDSGDYDYGGAFLAGVLPDSKGHWPDTFKKPNHPTFSDESQYAKDAPERAGHWDGEAFAPHGALPSYDELTQNVPDEIAQSKAQQEIERNATVPLWLGKALGYAQNVGKEAFSGMLPPEMMQTIFGGSESSLRPEERSKPIISPAVSKEIAGQLPAWAGGNTQFGQGLSESTANAISSFSAPGTLAQLPAFAIPGVAETYALNVLSELPDQGKKLLETADKYGWASKETGAVAGEYGITDLMGFLAGRHGALGRYADVARDIRRAPSFKAGEVPKVEPAQSAFPSEEIRQDVVSGRTEEAAKDNLLASRQELRPSAVQEVPQPEITPPIVEPSIKEKQDLGKPEPQELRGVQGQMEPPVKSGMVRLYHGASEGAGQAGTDFTPSREYAQGYAGKSQNGQVWYVDVPKDSPFLVRDEGNAIPGQEAPLINGQKLPDEIANKAKPLTATGEPNAVPIRSTTEEIPSPIERGENQQVSGERVRPSEQGKEIAGTGQAPEESQTTGIAQRVHEQRGVEIAPGEGIGAEDQIKRGRNLISEGVDPNQTLAQMKASGRINADDISVLRARHEELGRVTNAAEDTMRSRPNDPIARKTYDAAWQAETNWAKEIKPFQTEWHKIGMAQQGEVDIDTGTFTGLRRAVFQEKGRDVRPHEVGPLRQVADKVQAATAAEALARKRLSDAVKQITRKSVPHTAEELRNHFANRIRKLTPC